MAEGEKARRKVRPGLIEADPLESALLVHYDIEEIVDGEKQTKSSVKKIKLTSLSLDSDVTMVAQDVVDKCKLLSNSKLPLVVQAIQHILQRAQGGARDDEDDVEWESNMHESKRGALARFMGQAQESAAFDSSQHGSISLDQLDSYLEMLYEDSMEEKIKGTFLILQLVRDPDNLEVLIQNDQFLGVVTRLFREEANKSMDLVINIVYILFAFSNFSSFHETMTQYKMGDMVVKVIELEVKRQQHRKDDFEKRKATLAGEDLEKETKKLKITEKKQDKLLYVCFHVLLNMAEDINVERKMKKRGITKMLVGMLKRKSPELLLLTIAFLKKLSIFKENKDEMRECNIASELLAFVPAGSDEMTMAVLRLMQNLSFDTGIRTQLVKDGIIPKLVKLLKKAQFRHVTLKLLYQISTDDKCKSMFTYTDCIPMVVNMVQNFPEKLVEKTLIALAVNLAANARNAEAMAQGDNLNALLNRLFQSKDPLLAKMLRNLSQHDGAVKLRFAEFVGDLAALARQTQNPDLLVELLGILGNMTMTGSSAEGAAGQIPFSQILIDYDMINFLHNHLAGASEDDIMLEIIIFIGTCVSDPQCAPIFANSQLVAVLYDLMADKQEDDEMVLQITYTLFRCLQHESTRDVLLNHTQVVSYFVDLLYDKNAEIRKMADQTLDLVMEYDAEWAKQIRLRKFQIYNSQWLEAIERDGGVEGVSQVTLSEMFLVGFMMFLTAKRAMLRVNNAYQIEDEDMYEGDDVSGPGQMRVSDTFFVNDDEDDEDDFGYHD